MRLTKTKKGVLYLVCAFFSVAAMAANHATTINGQTVKIYQGSEVLYHDTPQEFSTSSHEEELEDKADVCVVPKVASECCNYTINDQHAGKNVSYKGPKAYFSNEANARNFVAQNPAKLPFFFPFTEDISLVAGWHYSSGSHHSGLDWWKTTVSAGVDVAFKVYAAAPGRVVTALWDNWFGNTVIIEHTAANGQKYRSVYMHLRNGFTHDLNKARAIVPPDANANDNWAKYKRFADLSNPNKLYWGQESHKLAVKAGDWVNGGQYLGLAGNTGAGGSGNGLKNDGTPSDTTRANNHLHFMLALPVPNQADNWVFVDAFGVYERAQSGCYELMKVTNYPRFFAPFYPSFHTLDADLLIHYFGYYPNMGLGLQTISTHYSGSNLLSTGSFQAQVNPQWLAHLHMNVSTFSSKVETYHQQGFRPRELSVVVTPQGEARFNAIWKKRGNESHLTFVNMSDADFSSKWSDYVGRQGYRLEDFVSYVVNGVQYNGAIFVKDGDGSFYFWRNMNITEFQQKFDELYGQGWRLVSFNIKNGGGDRRYAGIWQNVNGSWGAKVGLTHQGYQNEFGTMATQGYRPFKLQGYDNSTKFGVIWTK